MFRGFVSKEGKEFAIIEADTIKDVCDTFQELFEIKGYKLDNIEEVKNG